MFQYPHRIVGGFKVARRAGYACQIKFQYPHRIVGGFKDVSLYEDAGFGVVSVSSSDRRGVQELVASGWIYCSKSFSILIGSSGGSSPPLPLQFQTGRCFSILIGSSGGSRMPSFTRVTAGASVSVSSSDRRGVQGKRVQCYCLFC